MPFEYFSLLACGRIQIAVDISISRNWELISFSFFPLPFVTSELQDRPRKTRPDVTTLTFVIVELPFLVHMCAILNVNFFIIRFFFPAVELKEKIDQWKKEKDKQNQAK